MTANMDALCPKNKKAKKSGNVFEILSLGFWRIAKMTLMPWQGGANGTWRCVFGRARFNISNQVGN